MPIATDPVPRYRRPAKVRHTLRFPEDLWREVAERAYEQQETVTDVLVRAMREYVK